VACLPVRTDSLLAGSVISSLRQGLPAVFASMPSSLFPLCVGSGSGLDLNRNWRMMYH
jgi:hypothetical protein